MHACEFRLSCAYRNDLREKNPMLMESVNKAFCEANFSRCARFMLYQMNASYSVSKHLFPEDMDEAAIILENINGTGVLKPWAK